MEEPATCFYVMPSYAQAKITAEFTCAKCNTTQIVSPEISYATGYYDTVEIEIHGACNNCETGHKLTQLYP